MVYAVKTIPEDFFVREIIGLEFSEKGSFSYYSLKKKDFSTLEAINAISKKLKIPRKHINFAGTKDKRAVTEQAISVKGGPEKDFDFGSITLKFLGRGKERINLGSNKANYFEITVRNIQKLPETREWLVNYFDDQRFSSNNAEVGKAIIKKDFEKAVELILENKQKGYENKLADFLEKQQKDFVGALRTIDKKILMLYIHAYQAYLWNVTVSRLFENEEKTQVSYSFGRLNIPLNKPPFSKVELPGFSSESTGIMGEEGVKPRDFIVKEIPGISSEGAEREVITEASGFKAGKPENDELNKGKKKVIFSFELPKGSYATMFIKQLFSASP